MTRDVLAVEYNDCNVVIQLMNLSHQWLAFRHDNESSLQALSSVWSWSFVYEVVKKLKIFRYSDMEETQQRDSLFRFADKQLGGTIVL